MVTANNGVLIKAIDSKKANEQGTEEDRMRLAVQSALIDGEGKINITDTEGTAKGSLKKALIEVLGTTSPVVIGYTAGDGKINLNEKIYSIDIYGNIMQIQWELLNDNNNDDKVSVGDLLQPTIKGLENEKFYVLNIADDVLTLLAEKNVNTNPSINAQSANTNAVLFEENSEDEDPNTYSGSSIQGLVNAYIEKLLKNGLTLEDIEKPQGDNIVLENKGRLIWHAEVTDLGNDYSNMIYGPSNARLCYWTGSIRGPYNDKIWTVNGNSQSLVMTDTYRAEGWCGHENKYGVRPIISILKEKIWQ